MIVSKREILKEANEHPELVRKYGIGIAVQIATDHARQPKTTTKEGKRLYMKNYMRIERGSPLVPNLAEAIGLNLTGQSKRRKK